MDRTTLSLVMPFPREVGRWKRERVVEGGKTKVLTSTVERKMIWRPGEFQKFVEQGNGCDLAFSLHYPHQTINKLWFDFDAKAGVSEEEALMEAKKLYLWCVEKGYLSIPVASPDKGYHIYILTKPYSTNSVKEVLTSVSEGLITEVFGVKPKSLDLQACCDARRLARIPNTRSSLTGNFATYLPPDFHNMDIREIVEMRKAPHSYHYTGRTPELTDLVGVGVVRERKGAPRTTPDTIGCSELVSIFVKKEFEGDGYWMGLCPFHPDTNPSLAVYPDHFHCYGCGAHGGVLEFAEKIREVRYARANKEGGRS